MAAAFVAELRAALKGGFEVASRQSGYVPRVFVEARGTCFHLGRYLLRA